MKILKIHFQNLNSLTGEWLIDLSGPAYDGLFAITGPTGAGKSTLLDAVCLALYGRTPRLTKVTKSENEIMSRLTGECFAEVTFETEKGVYVSHWAQWRARKKVTGELQPPHHEVSCADGTILSSKLSEVPREVEKLTGMNFDRFTRSMLLAQGAFAAFLQAGSDERSPILEQITGTQIYSDISKAVFERAKEEEQTLAMLKSKIEGVDLLTDEEITKLTQEEKTLEAQSETERKALEVFRAEIAVIDAVEQLQADLSQVRQAKEALEKEKADFDSNRVRLEAAGRAKNIEADFVRLRSVEEAQKHDHDALDENVRIKPVLASALCKAQEDFYLADKQYKTKQGEESEVRKLWEIVRSLDDKIKHEKEELNEARKAHNELIAKLENLTKQEKDLNAKKAKAEQNRVPLASYLEKHSEDAKFVEAVSGLCVEVKHVTDRTHELEKIAHALDERKTEIVEAQKALKRANQLHDKAEEAVRLAEDKHKKLLAKHASLLEGQTQKYWEEKKESLQSERELRLVIQSLTEHRAHLEDGKPCPLCGALNHPYAAENIPALSEVDLQLQALKERQEGLFELRVKIETIFQKIQDKKLAVSKASVDKVSKEVHLVGLEKSVRGEVEKFEKDKSLHEENRKSLLKHFEDFGFVDEQDNLMALLKAIQDRVNKWSKTQEDITGIDKTLENIRNKHQLLIGQITTVNEEILSRKDPIQSRQSGIAKLQKERTERFGNQDVAQAQAQMTLAVQVAREAQEKAQSELNAAQTNRQVQETEEIRLNKAIAKRKQELTVLAASFARACEKQGFANRDAYLMAALPEETYQSLQKIDEDLRSREVKLVTRDEELVKQLEDKRDLRTSEESREMLVAKEKESNARYQDCLTKLGEIGGKLRANKETMAAHCQLLKECEVLQKAIAPWQNLRALIGSADGKRYRNFAQGLTFDVVISYANQQLRRMSDRYLLVRGNAESLDLDVIDNYQAVEQRSTKNLSGGESFIVSLALALGLSKMASHNVRVDSLFLDEGFGTLDDRALDLALDTLSLLREDGKLIGVISHVKTLKERVGTQITVVPGAGGKSRLEGPGCERIQ